MTGPRREWIRQAGHIGLGGFALALRWLQPWQAALGAGLILLFNLFALHRLTRGALLRPAERERGYSWGIALYPAVVLSAILVFHRRLELAAAVWGLFAFGDGMATLAGRWIGGPRLPWNPAKSWSGLTAFVLYGTASSALLIRWTQHTVLDATAANADHVGNSFLATRMADGRLSDAAFLLLGCLVAALAAGMAESVDVGIDDNLLVPLVGGAVLYAATLVEVGRLVDATPRLLQGLAIGGSLNAGLAVVALAVRGVSRSGAVWGWLLGTSLYAFAGWRGLLLLGSLFVLGTVTTRLGYARKDALGIAESRGGRRGGRSAVANSTVGIGFAFLAVASSYPELSTVAMVAAFAAATCDTVSSEIGQAFGRRHVRITTFRPAPAGSDGAVSVEGTLAGWFAASAVAGVAWASGLVGPGSFAVAATAGVIGATAESCLASLALRRIAAVDNESMNFATTLIGAAAACLMFVLFDPA